MNNKDILRLVKDYGRSGLDLYKTLNPEINFADFEAQLEKLEEGGLVEIKTDFMYGEDWYYITPKGRKLTNTLIVIGHLGIRTAYLNIDRESALKRWETENGNYPDIYIEEFNFDDEFGVYDAWEIE